MKSYKKELIPVCYYWWLMGLAVLIVVVLANPSSFYFLNDDFIHIPKAFDGTLGHNNSVRHVGDFSLYLDSLWTGSNPTGYHTTNLLLHIANTLLIVPLLLRIGRSFQSFFPVQTAVLSATLFGVYAFHSEAIFWIIGRSASLSLFFNILCWLCFFQALKKRLWLIPMSLWFVAALFTYEAVWVFPFWLLLWFFLLPGNTGQRSRAVVPIVMIWGLFILYFPIRLAATGELLGSYEANDVQQMHIVIVLQKAASLFARSFLPPVYGHTWFAAIFMLVAILLTLLIRWLWIHQRSNRLLLFFIAAWILSYIPYISLGISTTGYQSERYLYFPSLFLSAFLVYGFVLLGQKKKTLSLALIVTLFAYHLTFFVKADQDFKTISRYAKEGIIAIQNVPAKKKLVIKNLPAYSYGFPVFDYGFTEAIAWMTPYRDSGSVIVLNKMDYGKKEILHMLNHGKDVDTLSFYSR